MSTLKYLSLFLIFVITRVWGDLSPAIVYVHIGDRFPSYFEESLNQARRFNPKVNIYLIANERALADFERDDVIKIPCESIPRSEQHTEFVQKTKFSEEIKNGYWRFTSERFLYLYDFMTMTGITHLFHIENDVMLYRDLEELLPLFEELNYGLTAPFESDSKCIPCFVFLPNVKSLEPLVDCFVEYASEGWTDMKIFSQLRKEKGESAVDCLPLIFPSYVEDKFLKPEVQRPFCKNVEEFQSIFDGSCIGLYLGGESPISDLIDPNDFLYSWGEDEQGRKIPYVTYNSQKLRINNLHIITKNLKDFASS